MSAGGLGKNKILRWGEAMLGHGAPMTLFILIPGLELQ